MTSHDVRDMLDLPGEAAPRPAKKQKTSGPRPVLKGLAREVQNLGGDNPIALVPEASLFKKKRFGSRKPAAKWENQPFINSARNDKSLVLRHWRKKADSPAPALEDEGAQASVKIEDSAFAKYNVKVIAVEYSNEQYQRYLQNDDWSRDETDYLVTLVRDYDLRWTVIWDRYEYQPPAIQTDDSKAVEVAIVTASKPRTMEDLKARYYSIAATMMKVNKPPEQMIASEYSLMEKMLNFNPQQEVARKLFAEAMFHRTREEANEEEHLLVELKRIQARSEKLNEERHELYATLDAPTSTGNISAYTTSAGLQQLLQQLMQVDKSKKRKSLMGPDGNSPAGANGLSQQGGYDRRESSVRESISGPSSGNNKKGPAQGMERRELDDAEKILYGVKIFDRISTSGPAFRAERINKPITNKSTIQQQKILGVLTELGVPHRLTMPTAAVGQVFESLLADINTLLDSRKIQEKLLGEINTLKAVQKQREEDEAAQVLRTQQPNTESSDNVTTKVEETEREKSAAPSNNGPGRKRSMSVMSSVSDKSAKRQKK
jgi:DNA methyltransferase 1-associated protein 1